MDIQEQRIAEAKRRLAHAYREAGDAYIAKQVEIGINMVVPVGVIADLLTEMVWEPPVDLKVAALQEAQELYCQASCFVDGDGVMCGVRAVFDAGIAFAEGR